MNQSTLGPIAALGAMGLALTLAMIEGRPARPVADPGLGWATAIEQALDHVGPRELAALLATDPPGAVVIDVRPVEEFAGFHLPAALNFDLPNLLGAPGQAVLDANRQRLVVLCSNGMTHPAQAWVELTRRGYTNIRVLEDGLDGFVRDVLTPPSLRPGTSEGQAAAEFAAFDAARARFLPRSTPRSIAATTAVRIGIASDPAELSTPAIVSTDWLASRVASVVLIDTRESDEDFAKSHLPGARHVPTKALRGIGGDGPTELLPPAEVAKRLGTFGITPGDTVVAYGDKQLQDPTHFALAMISVGHRRIGVLEGGFGAWVAQGRAVTAEPTVVAPTSYAPGPTTELVTAHLTEVARASETGAPTIVDVRPANAFRGEVSTEARAGHIPRSRNRPYTTDVIADAGGVFWRPVDELAAEYATLGIAMDRPVIISCRTGHQASQTWFVLRYVLGHPDVRWYDGSWQEWALHSELPAATGSEPPQ